ncbi:DUF2059 domain-containing protein [Dyella tabacisoli]|uniref:DUF2059 domain-containing protein n=1 Tax=Dyella tabacisoli TaxID=2282381 RepID=A0A369UH71_9GAMM|nr:DUF2059 domain-containing protein [Dyella tabacisoli]RDD79911.1 DUF2059 domain-containing protein [Dyella tabacisoli]
MTIHPWTKYGAGLMLAVCAGQAIAAQPSEDQVRQLMDAVGVGKMLSQMNGRMATIMQQSLPCVPGSYWQGFVDANGTQQLIGRMIPIYQRNFTAEDVDGLLKFYRSPLGQKVIAKMPETMAEGMQVGNQWGQERGKEMILQLQQKGTLGADGRCPATAAPANTQPQKPAAPAKGKR